MQSTHASWRADVLALLHAALVICVVGHPKALLAYFLLVWLLLASRAFVPDRLRPLHTCAAIGLLLIAVLWYRNPVFPSWLLGLPLGARMKPLVGRFASGTLQGIGVSYCFLRAVYLLLDPRSWSLPELIRYYFFFPTFLSGPVMAPAELLDQSGGWSWSCIHQGNARIISGLMRIVVASGLAEITMLGSAEQVRWAIDQTHSPLWLWVGVFLSGLQLYFNFSGFSELFIGLACWSGVTAPENFNRPYAACDITSFWQRWHISLASWLRAVIYTPLTQRLMGPSGQRQLPVALLAPILTMLVCGLWHRASLAFLIWGGMHGLALSGHWLWQQRLRGLLPERVTGHTLYAVGCWVLLHGYVSLTWVFFMPLDRAVGLESRLTLARRLLQL